ncbi:hypothetical protein N9H13_02460, partial [bacterium]|nr:hypothetical protein [bacterium]
TELTGWYTPGSDWGARLQGFDFSWSDAEIEPLDLVFNQRLGSRWQDFDVSFNHLDLTVLTDLLGQSRIPSEQILSIIDQMRPQGELDALTLGRNEQGYFASMNLNAVDVQPYRGVPGVKGLSGYVEVSEQGGLFHVADNDGFEVFFPQLYPDYLRVDSAVGTTFMDWQAETKTLILRSEPVLAKMDLGTSQIMYSIKITVPIISRAPVSQNHRFSRCNTVLSLLFISYSQTGIISNCSRANCASERNWIVRPINSSRSAT